MENKKIIEAGAIAGAITSMMNLISLNLEYIILNIVVCVLLGMIFAFIVIKLHDKIPGKNYFRKAFFVSFVPLIVLIPLLVWYFMLPSLSIQVGEEIVSIQSGPFADFFDMFVVVGLVTAIFYAVIEALVYSFVFSRLIENRHFIY